MAFRVKRVIDVSNVNPADLSTLKASHADAIICKATEGMTFHDKTFTATRQAAYRLHKPFGSYLFLRPFHDGAAQAKAYLRFARPHVGDIQPIIDTEVMDGKSWFEVARCVDDCARALEAHGFRPILYASTSFVQQLRAEYPSLKRLHVWQAEYPGWLPRALKFRLRRRHKIGGTVVMWQYTSKWRLGRRRFDMSYLLAPVKRILIPHRGSTALKRRG